MFMCGMIMSWFPLPRLPTNYAGVSHLGLTLLPSNHKVVYQRKQDTMAALYEQYEMIHMIKTCPECSLFMQTILSALYFHTPEMTVSLAVIFGRYFNEAT